VHGVDRVVVPIGVGVGEDALLGHEHRAPDLMVCRQLGGITDGPEHDPIPINAGPPPTASPGALPTPLPTSFVTAGRLSVPTPRTLDSGRLSVPACVRAEMFLPVAR